MRQMQDRNIPKKMYFAYYDQRNKAKNKGIQFYFTMTEWWEWWKIDDRWKNRGILSHNFVMARYGDVGPYSIDNVYIATNKQNLFDRWNPRNKPA
jgi:hypothetical protein